MKWHPICIVDISISTTASAENPKTILYIKLQSICWGSILSSAEILFPFVFHSLSSINVPQNKI